MKLESIEIENFRAFHGKHDIKLSTDDNKPVNVIVAQNNVGKSAILEAIYWCLFDEMPFGADKIDDKINNQSEELDETASAVVKLNIIDDSSEEIEKFRITRTLPSENSDTIFTAIRYDRDEKSYDEDDPRTLVNRILPKNLKDFFLFRGEGVEDLFDKKEERLKTSLEHIQGLTYLETARKDLEQYLTSLMDKRSRQIKLAEKSEATTANLNELYEKKEAILKRLDQNKKDISESEDAIEQFKQLINESGVEEIKIKNKDSERLKIKIKTEIDPQIEKIKTLKIKLIEENGYRVFGYSYKEKVEAYMDEQRSKGKFPADYSEAFLKNILEAGECVCGDVIDESKEKILQQNLGEGLTNEQDRITRDIAAELGAFKVSNERHQSDSYRMTKELQKLDLLKKQYKDQIKDNDQFIKDHKNLGEKDISKWQTNMKSEEVTLKKLLREQGSLDIKFDAANDIFKKARHQADKLGHAATDNKINIKISNIKEALDLLNKNIDESRDIIRNGLLKTLKNLTKKYSTLGETFIYANEDSFNPLLVERNQKNERVLNKGDLTMKAIYFACAAIMQNQNREQDAGRFITKGTIAPMVVDAPFSNLDQNNLRSATKMITDCCRQSLILVNYKDYQNFIEEVKKSGKLGKHYYIQRSVKEELTGTDVNLEMDIEGKKIASHLMGQKLTTSKIYEVEIK
tara:strand:- start:894 stop:2957 length:2064 start_codon:yes stop_codon:yes gene_type:complete